MKIREGIGSRVSVFACDGGYSVEMKEFFVEDAVRFENETVTSYFLLTSMQVREKKQGGQYLALIVSDRTGSLEARSLG